MYKTPAKPKPMPRILALRPRQRTNITDFQQTVRTLPGAIIYLVCSERSWVHCCRHWSYRKESSSVRRVRESWTQCSGTRRSHRHHWCWCGGWALACGLPRRTPRCGASSSSWCGVRPSPSSWRREGTPWSRIPGSSLVPSADRYDDLASQSAARLTTQSNYYHLFIYYAEAAEQIT